MAYPKNQGGQGVVKNHKCLAGLGSSYQMQAGGPVGFPSCSVEAPGVAVWHMQSSLAGPVLAPPFVPGKKGNPWLVSMGS